MKKIIECTSNIKWRKVLNFLMPKFKLSFHEKNDNLLSEVQSLTRRSYHSLCSMKSVNLCANRYLAFFLLDQDFQHRLIVIDSLF